MNIGDCIAWWRFTHPELFAGWVGLLLADILVLVSWAIWEAYESAAACKINNDDGCIEWKWDT